MNCDAQWILYHQASHFLLLPRFDLDFDRGFLRPDLLYLQTIFYSTIILFIHIPIYRNVIHGSDSKDSAAREIKLWFGDNEVFSWASHSQADLYE